MTAALLPLKSLRTRERRKPKITTEVAATPKIKLIQFTITIQLDFQVITLHQTKKNTIITAEDQVQYTRHPPIKITLEFKDSRR